MDTTSQCSSWVIGTQILAKKKHYESDSTPGLMELEGKQDVDTNQ
jgi:hypothetical protein